ncbi:MAG: RluA family pseudouridine synthase [Metamycoplasmataceae bacterium]
MEIDIPIVLLVDKKERIDKFIANATNISRNDIQQIIEEYGVYVNDMLVRKVKFIVFEGQTITIKNKIEKEIKAIPENIPFEIIYEDDDILIINKESGMVVHPSPGHTSGTLVNALLFYCKNLSNLNGDVRPGIVHRIDKDTSGLILVAKNNKAHNYYAGLLKNHEIKREYIALVDGIINNNITHINAPIGRDPQNRLKYKVVSQNSKEAFSSVYVLKKYAKNTLIKVLLKTGRTHQIRVHLSYINHPIFGDELYNHKIDDFNQRLHAYKISFLDMKNIERSFFAPLPKIFFDKTNLNENIEEINKLL